MSLTFVEQRRYKRLPVLLEGKFISEHNQCGLIMVTDSTRNGLRGTLNRPVPAGTTIHLELWLPADIIPLTAIGTVERICRNDRDWQYPWESGITITQIDPSDRWRLMDFSYEYWKREYTFDANGAME